MMNERTAKSIVPVCLALAIAAETVAEGLNKSPALPPHIQAELKAPAPGPAVPLVAIGGDAGNEPLGIVRQRILYAKTHRARRLKDERAMASAYIDTARAIMRLRELQPWERQMQFSCLKWEIELTNLRTRGCCDYSAALPAIANALRVAYDPTPAKK